MGKKTLEISFLIFLPNFKNEDFYIFYDHKNAIFCIKYIFLVYFISLLF